MLFASGTSSSGGEGPPPPPPPPVPPRAAQPENRGEMTLNRFMHGLFSQGYLLTAEKRRKLAYDAQLALRRAKFWRQQADAFNLMLAEDTETSLKMQERFLQMEQTSKRQRLRQPGGSLENPDLAPKPTALPRIPGIRHTAAEYANAGHLDKAITFASQAVRNLQKKLAAGKLTEAEQQALAAAGEGGRYNPLAPNFTGAANLPPQVISSDSEDETMEDPGSEETGEEEEEEDLIGGQG